MKRNMISVALFAMLATMAVGCQKENYVDSQSTVASVGSVRTVLYTINGVEHLVTLYGDEEWDAFVDSMMSLAQQGYNVSFVNQNVAESGVATKDVQTFTTPSQEEAKAWSKEKAEQGYTVSTTYKDGLYICVAVRK